MGKDTSLTAAEREMLERFRAGKERASLLPLGFSAATRKGMGAKTKGLTLSFVALRNGDTTVEVALNVAEVLLNTFQTWSEADIVNNVKVLADAIGKVKAARPPKTRTSNAIGYTPL